MMQFKEAIWDLHNQLLKEYDDEATREISRHKQLFYFLKEEKTRKDGE